MPSNLAPVARNPALLCVFRALQMSLFPMAILTLFYRDHLGMSMTEIMFVQGAFGLAMVLFEFPSGYLADRIGYRRSLLIAAVLNGLGWSIYARADSIVGVVVGELVLGIGISLISGGDAALLYESLDELGQEERYGQWNGRVRFWGQLGEGTAAALAGVMFAYWARLPFVIEAIVWVVNLLVASRLIEPKRDRPPARDNLAQVKALTKHLMREAPRLRAVMMLTVALGMASFIPVWTIQLYATDAGVPAKWLGVVWAAANYSVAFASLAATPVHQHLGLQRLMLVCVGLIAVGYLGMGLSHAVWGFLFYYALTTMRGLFSPPLHHLEQRLIPSRDRAGLLSMRSLMFRGVFLVIGPASGVAIDRYGQHPVLLGLGAAVVFWCLVSLGALRGASPDGELEAI